MNKKDLERFKKILEDRRNEIVTQGDSVKESGITFSQDDLPDEVDLASVESDQSMNLRLRDRERILMRKIEKGLEKIAANQYGICEECGEEISVKRLEARPVTDLCIRCKEEQERVERSFAES
jgi:DnaK suppressor protein